MEGGGEGRGGLRLPWGWRLDPGATAIGLFLVALAAGVATIAHESLWFDEAVTVRVGRMGPDRFEELATRTEPFWAFYYSLIRPWMALGDSAAWLRLPSAIAAATTVSLTYLVGRRLVGEAAALGAGIVLVFHAFLLNFAQEARGYTVALALLVGATLAFALAFERPRWWAWVVYAALGTGAVYAHFIAALVIAGHGLIVLIRIARGGWSRGGRGAALALVAIVVGTLPLSTWIALEPAREFVRPVTVQRLGLALTWLGGLPLGQAGVAFIAMMAAVYGTVALGAARLMRAAVRQPDGWRPVLLLTWLLFPLAITLAVSLTVKPAFTDKYVFLSLPAVALTIGVAVAGIGARWWRLLTASAVGVVLIAGMWPTLFMVSKPDWNAAASIALQDARRGDVVVTQPVWQWTPLEYAMDQCTDGSIPERRPIGADDDPRTILAELRDEGRRIWVVLFDYRRVPLHESLPYLDLLERGRERLVDEVVPYVRVMLFEPDGSSPLAVGAGRGYRGTRSVTSC